ncbi:hypothetical protein P153DRAFT_369047 [Dothidotthia symphoricarpi CBS 119687]|uniref:Uncharacterized protein n=1 Tax=Dothidotthia symphoricarpi CBS 119687 TaxID=1392245 RepID=A0A6A6A371_9PLEO|nr:uncharacterized protein P153DRAFT_369047 [Dothidotthia symphoricarpi CBS 119687]KAF2126319.1 hypothetical protein P153DRAFT_369047 [Dothidotthia symphoricarpi CBS 119687]
MRFTWIAKQLIPPIPCFRIVLSFHPRSSPLKDASRLFLIALQAVTPAVAPFTPVKCCSASISLVGQNYSFLRETV